LTLTAFLAAAGSPVPGHATAIHFTLDARDPEGGKVAVSFEVSEYPFDTVRMELGGGRDEFKGAAGSISNVTMRAGDGAISHGADDDGRLYLSGIDGGFTGSYEIAPEQLTEAIGVGPTMPVFSSERMVLPLASIVALPEEVDTRGLAVTTISIDFVLPDGWPLLAPWKSYGGRVSLHDEPLKEFRSAFIVSGDVEVVDELQMRPPILLMAQGGSLETVRLFKKRIRSLNDYVSRVFADLGKEPLCVLIEMGEYEPVVHGSGRYFRIQCPEAMIASSGERLRLGTGGRRFYRTLARRLFHRWLGFAGRLEPIGKELNWFTLGAADYLGEIALAQGGMTLPEAPLRFLAEVARTYRDLPDRAVAVNLTPERFDTDPVFRTAVRVKGTLACFALESELLQLTPESRRLSNIIRGIYYHAFLHSQGNAMLFSEVDLAREVGELIKPLGDLVLSRMLDSDLFPVLPTYADSVGIEGREADDGTITLMLRREGGELYRTVLQGTPSGRSTDG